MSEGKITDMATDQADRRGMRLELIEPQKGEKGGYRSRHREVKANDEGRWVLKTPNGWHRIVIEADGYVPRIVGHIRFDGGMGWHQYDGSVASPGGGTRHRQRRQADRRRGGAAVEHGKKEGRYESPSETHDRTNQRQLPPGDAALRRDDFDP